jgi:hypothetical protein
MQGKRLSAAQRDAAINSVAELLGMTPKAVRRAVAAMPDNAEMHQLRSEITRAKATAAARRAGAARARSTERPAGFD